MTNSKHTKRALLASVLSVVMCVAMLVGTTFAWFTDSVTSGNNKIQAGNLKADLIHVGGGEEGADISIQENPDHKIFNYDKWEPNYTVMETLKVVNNGNLAFKFRLDAVAAGATAGPNGEKLADVIDVYVYEGTDNPADTTSFAEMTEANGWRNAGSLSKLMADPDGIAHGELLPIGATSKNGEPVGSVQMTVALHMQETAGNEYQGLTLGDLNFTLNATQYTFENDSFDNQYDKDTDTAHYTLAEFNALTEIPEDVKVVYLNIGDVSLKDDNVTIGNKRMADVYTSVTGNYYVGQKLDDGKVVTSVWNESKKTYLANSNKPGITLYISGSVKDNPEGGLNQSDSHAINFVIPDASNVVFTKDFTVNGYFRCGFSWNDNTNLGGGVASHKIQSVLFDHSTFNGIWIQNGSFFADSLTLDGCTFNVYENKVFANDSNPLWFCNIRSCDVTVKNCTFKASRPIKVVEQTVNGADITIINNTFDMSETNTGDSVLFLKNDAIMFSDIATTSTLGNVVVSGNRVTEATALLTFFKPSKITMAQGATFKVSDNTLNDAKLSVTWKTNNEYIPDFVEN